MAAHDTPSLLARYGRIGTVARWKPVHLGHEAMLVSLLERADHLVIGIGSANKHDARNPFTAAETRDMLERILNGRNNFEIIEVPDLGHGPRWRAQALALYGPLDLFVSENDYVRSLLAPVYPTAIPVRFVPPERRVPVDGTMVRRAMARGGDWRALVPSAVAAYLDERELVTRFRREFGLETLAQEAGPG